MNIDLGYVLAVAIAATSAAAGFRWSRLRRLAAECAGQWHLWQDDAKGGLICGRCFTKPVLEVK